jgi:ubiquinone/menaquinone biosynthesis C-methylase UbiE
MSSQITDDRATTMYERSVKAHYGATDLGARILAALEAKGTDVHSLSRSDLHAFDELHIGGAEWTRTLARLAAPQQGEHVLDIGSGLGGPSRTLAAEFGCTVVGLEITEAFRQTAEMLTDRVGLSEQVSYQQGNALDLPFDDGVFDLAWMQHVAMNIPDKNRLFKEVGRVLKEGGKLVTHTILAGDTRPIHYPVVWAADPEIDFVEPEGPFRKALRAGGLEELVWQDVTERETSWYRSALAQLAGSSSGPPILALFIENLADKAKNTLRNLEEGRITVAQAVYQKRADA